jgi:hypothetical protein
VRRLLSDRRIAMLRRLDPEELLAEVGGDGEISKMIEGDRGRRLKNALAGGHKARVKAARHFEPDEIAASKKWLRAQGYIVPSEVRT